MFMGPWNWCQGMNSASLCSLAGRYENPIPLQCLAPIDFLKIPALVYSCSVLPSLCRTFRPVQKKNFKKILSQSNFHFAKEFGREKKTIFVRFEWENNNIPWTFLELERRREKKFVKLCRFSPFFVQNRSKFGRRFVRSFHFFFGPFRLMRPNNRSVGDTALVFCLF